MLAKSASVLLMATAACQPRPAVATATRVNATHPKLYTDLEAENFNKALAGVDFTTSRAEVLRAIGLDRSRLRELYGAGMGRVIVTVWELSPSYELRETTNGTFQDGATILIERKKDK